jgi:hypothetical protein
MSRVRETMIAFNDFVLLLRQVGESFGILADWFSDTFVQVGLGVVIWAGYVRHWVSFIFQCHLLKWQRNFVGRIE